jgi:hypothetical protein
MSCAAAISSSAASAVGLEEVGACMGSDFEGPGGCPAGSRRARASRCKVGARFKRAADDALWQ